jgi:hypothetical protein
MLKLNGGTDFDHEPRLLAAISKKQQFYPPKAVFCKIMEFEL